MRFQLQPFGYQELVDSSPSYAEEARFSRRSAAEESHELIVGKTRAHSS
jgi:hypothetical protein